MVFTPVAGAVWLKRQSYKKTLVPFSKGNK